MHSLRFGRSLLLVCLVIWYAPASFAATEQQCADTYDKAQKACNETWQKDTDTYLAKYLTDVANCKTDYDGDDPEGKHGELGKCWVIQQDGLTDCPVNNSDFTCRDTYSKAKENADNVTLPAALVDCENEPNEKKCDCNAHADHANTLALALAEKNKCVGEKNSANTKCLAEVEASYVECKATRKLEYEICVNNKTEARDVSEEKVNEAQRACSTKASKAAALCQIGITSEKCDPCATADVEAYYTCQEDYAKAVHDAILAKITGTYSNWRAWHEKSTKAGIDATKGRVYAEASGGHEKNKCAYTRDHTIALAEAAYARKTSGYLDNGVAKACNACENDDPAKVTECYQDAHIAKESAIQKAHNDYSHQGDDNEWYGCYWAAHTVQTNAINNINQEETKAVALALLDYNKGLAKAEDTYTETVAAASARYTTCSDNAAKASKTCYEGCQP